MFWKKDKIKLEWTSTVAGLLDIEEIRPRPASQFLPEWFKKTPVKAAETVTKDALTIKRCPSFPQLLSSGYVVPMWCDSYIRTDGKRIEWRTPWDEFIWHVHTHDQFLDHLPKEEADKYGIVLKPQSPWQLKTPKGYSVYISSPYFHFGNKFHVIPGIFNTDYYHSTHTPMLIEKTDDWLLIPRGTPLFTVIPFKRESYVSEFIPYTSEVDNYVKTSFMRIETKFTSAYNQVAKKLNINKNNYV